MTSLTGLTASQAAEELRRYTGVFLNMDELRVLASLLEQGARDTERLRHAIGLMDRAVAQLKEPIRKDHGFLKDFYLFTGDHMILTEEGWESGESRQAYLDEEAKHPEYGAFSILDEVNAPSEGGPA